MAFRFHFSDEAKADLLNLENNPALAKRFRAVRSALGKLQNNPRHPSLNTHKFSDRKDFSGEDLFEAYAENNTPGAYRIFWYYGPGKDMITILMITPHP